MTKMKQGSSTTKKCDEAVQFSCFCARVCGPDQRRAPGDREGDTRRAKKKWDQKTRRRREHTTQPEGIQFNIRQAHVLFEIAT